MSTKDVSIGCSLSFEIRWCHSFCFRILSGLYMYCLDYLYFVWTIYCLDYIVSGLYIAWTIYCLDYILPGLYIALTTCCLNCPCLQSPGPPDAGQFYCPYSRRSIPLKWCCDRQADCEFGEDEANCGKIWTCLVICQTYTAKLAMTRPNVAGSSGHTSYKYLLRYQTCAGGMLKTRPFAVIYSGHNLCETCAANLINIRPIAVGSGHV